MGSYELLQPPPFLLVFLQVFLKPREPDVLSAHRTPFTTRPNMDLTWGVAMATAVTYFSFFRHGALLVGSNLSQQYLFGAS